MTTPFIDGPNIISRYKERKFGRNTMLFGRHTEADANARSNARQMFDGDMLIHGDLLVSPNSENVNAQQPLEASSSRVLGMRS